MTPTFPTPADEAAWAADLSAAIDNGITALRWLAAVVATYITASIGAALWVAA